MSRRVIVITGASRGLGLEWVRQLSQDPTNFIIAVVRNPDKIELLRPFLGRETVIAVKGDVSDIQSFPATAEKIAEVGGGKVDRLINNAGVMVGTGASPAVGISQSTVEEWNEQFNINVIGLVFFTIALIPLLERGEEKKVVNITSMLGDLRFTEENPLHFSSYSATKAAVTMANAKFHLEFKDRGFTFLALNPGWVNTDLAGAEMGKMAPLQPGESISHCLRFVNRSSVEDSGKFWSLDGLSDAVMG